MSKRTKVIGPLALMPILILNGCADDHPQRDVYTGKDAQEALANCAEDWGSKDLCSEITDSAQLDSIGRSQCNEDEQGPCYVPTQHYAYGPQYMSRHRTVTHNSFVYVPMSSRASGFRIQPLGSSGFTGRGFSSFSSSRGAISISRGGFGSTGAHVSGFGGS